LVFLAIWAIRPRLCSVHIQSLNHKSPLRKTPILDFPNGLLEQAFALMQSKESFEEIMDELHGIARTSGVRLPSA
jgi:hypothetical protein